MPIFQVGRRKFGKSPGTELEIFQQVVGQIGCGAFPDPDDADIGAADHPHVHGLDLALQRQRLPRASSRVCRKARTNIVPLIITGASSTTDCLSGGLLPFHPSFRERARR